MFLLCVEVNETGTVASVGAMDDEEKITDLAARLNFLHALEHPEEPDDREKFFILEISDLKDADPRLIVKMFGDKIQKWH